MLKRIFEIMSLGFLTTQLLGCFNSPVPWGLNAGNRPSENRVLGIQSSNLILTKITAMDLGPADYEKLSIRAASSEMRSTTSFEVKKYVLSIILSPDSKSFAANVDISVNRKSSTATDFPLDMDNQLALDGVAIDGQVTDQLSRVEGGLDLSIPPATPDAFKLSIQYHCSLPTGGLYFAEIGQQVVQAWTLGEPVEARMWFPGVDRPDSKAPVEEFVTVPSDWKVLGNGSLVGTSTPNSRQTTYHWDEKFPLATYLTSFLAGKLDVVDSGNTSLPVTYWVPHDDVDQANLGFKLVPDMIRFYSQKLFAYPFEKYSIGVAYNFPGATEHTTATTFSQSSNSPRDGFEPAVAAHELSHHWFGDTVTCANWDELWLNEGFASYFDVLFWESLDRDRLLDRMESYKKRYLAQEMASGNGSLGPVYNPNTPPEEKFNSVSYNKGALVLHTLRYELGDASFYKGLSHYLEKFKFGSATSEDLRQALEESTGTNLKTFFDQWVYGSGVPEISYSWSWDDNQKKVKVKIDQTQKAPIRIFDTHIDVYMEYLDSKQVSQSLTQTVEINSSSQNFEFAVPSQPTMVILDPKHWVLASVSAEKSDGEWRKILRDGPTSLARIEAIVILDSKLSLKDINDVLSKDASDYVKAAAISKLRNYDDSSHQRIESIARPFLKAPGDVLRIEAAKLFGTIQDKNMVPELLDAYKYDVYNYVSMQAGFSLGMIGDSRAFDAFIADIYMNPHRDYMVLSAAVTGLGMLGDRRATPHLLGYFNEGTPARWMKAIAAASLGMLKDPRAVDPIGQALIKEPRSLIALSYISALDQIGDRSAISYLQNVVNNPSRADKVRVGAQSAIDDLSK